MCFIGFPDEYYESLDAERERREQEKREKEKKEAIITIAAWVSFITISVTGIMFLAKKENKKNNQRNASYIVEATIDTPYYDWCLSAVNIDTIVCIVEGKAHLYEIDEGREEFLENFKNGFYKVIGDNGEYRYIPVSMALSFPTHEEAEEYAKQMVGEENIICANYPKHNSAKTRKLVP